jgi:uncharacterized lipoprotein
MRSFILVAAALVVAGLDGCSRPPRPLRPHKEPHAQVTAPVPTGLPSAAVAARPPTAPPAR